MTADLVKAENNRDGENRKAAVETRNERCVACMLFAQRYIDLVHAASNASRFANLSPKFPSNSSLLGFNPPVHCPAALLCM